jgi:hypothetical protein
MLARVLPDVLSFVFAGLNPRTDKLKFIGHFWASPLQEF